MVWLYNQEPVCTFQKGPPPEKAKLRRWRTYLSQLQLSVHHIQVVQKECADYISRNNFDDVTGARSEELAKEAVSSMDVHLDHLYEHDQTSKLTPTSERIWGHLQTPGKASGTRSGQPGIVEA